MVEVYLIMFFWGFGNSLLPLYDGTPTCENMSGDFGYLLTTLF